jgi:hypothetical protein
MTSTAGFIQPPRIASWFLNLFTLPDEEESILGDLLEEFSLLASKSGVTFARSWYWRQAVKTIAHLFATAFRVAPWSTTAAVVGGFLLHMVVSRLPDKLLSPITDKYLFYWSAHFQAYLWILKGMLIADLILSIFVGCMVALVAKGREMVATVTLVLIQCALILIGTAWVWIARPGLIGVASMLWSCVDPCAIVLGGTIVRMLRSAANPPPLRA